MAARKGPREEQLGAGGMWAWGAQTQAGQGAGVKGEWAFPLDADI